MRITPRVATYAGGAPSARRPSPTIRRSDPEHRESRDHRLELIDAPLPQAIATTSHHNLARPSGDINAAGAPATRDPARASTVAPTRQEDLST